VWKAAAVAPTPLPCSAISSTKPACAGGSSPDTPLPDQFDRTT
jgi:hypothetical protein